MPMGAHCDNRRRRRFFPRACALHTFSNMAARRMLELLFLSAIACGDPAREDDVGRTASPLDVTVPASELGLEDAIFQKAESDPLLLCPPHAPFICRAENDTGWACSEISCAPSCEKIGCPGNWECVDLGSGPQCEPP
jgi:hypothetical protein